MTEQEKMWNRLKTLPYDFRRDGITWLAPVEAEIDLITNTTAKNGDCVLVGYSKIFVFINKSWKKIG